MDEDLESEEIKKEYESQKEKIEKEESDYLKQAKEIAKNNKKFKRSQLDSDSDDINEGKGKDDPKSDEKYFSNVVKHIDEDQQESKINDVYGVSYLNDNNEIETKEVQYKLR